MSESTKPGSSDEPAFRYTAAMAGEIEARWQAYWIEHGTFEAPNPSGPLGPRADGPSGGAPPITEGEHAFEGKRYIMDMFPYPSGSGLHVGHPLGFIATDVFGRYQRMLGRNVLHTMGFDAFGLPAEQYAVQTGTHPRVTTEKNIERYRAQIARIGLAHDRRRGVATTDVSFYRWTQWIFLQIFNSWYDTAARRARPIAELVAEFEAGTRATPDSRPWSALSAGERADVIDGYRLAYIAEAPVNWCPGLGTVLANEEVTADGRSERGNFPVFKRNLRQWMMRITAYADRLLEDLERLDWPEPIKLMQRNWIGRSEGARVRFPIDGTHIEVFTTRPDTLFGATYMVLAPEHPLVEQIVPAQWPEGTKDAWTGGASTPAEAVAAYKAQAAAKTEVERQTEGRQKTGVFTGAHATNPVNGERVPVFVADYVLWGYGTGAIMAVPAHDQRDFEFARAFHLPMRIVVSPGSDASHDIDTWTEAFDSYDAQSVNSANAEISLNGLVVTEAKKRIIAWLEEKGDGTGTVTYRLRDWLFSRQRYWGEPFPIVYDAEDPTHAIALPESMLPLELPDIDDYSPRTFEPDDVHSEPSPPLARAAEWVGVQLDLGDGRGVRHYRRETNTMPQWAGSCWYYLRYLDPTNEDRFVGVDVEKYWMGPRDAADVGGADLADVEGVETADLRATADVGGVDLYVGGAEHAVLHLLYSRFWHKVLYDLGHVSSAEPFRKLFNQGYIQAYAYTDDRGVYVPAEEVEEVDGVYYHQGRKVNREYGKMGKSLKNSVTPDEFCDTWGADTLRVYEMSMGPLEVSRPWETKAVSGSFRFLQRVWRNIVDEETGEVRVGGGEPDLPTLRALHVAIAGVHEDLDNLRFNTAIAKLIVLNNHLTKLPEVPRDVAEALVVMVAPIAPHMAEELWRKLGHANTVAYEPYPVADPQYLVADEVTCVVQVAGKLRDKLQVPPDISEDALRELALASEGVQHALDGRGVRTVIVRAPKLVNVVPA